MYLALEQGIVDQHGQSDDAEDIDENASGSQGRKSGNFTTRRSRRPHPSTWHYLYSLWLGHMLTCFISEDRKTFSSFRERMHNAVCSEPIYEIALPDRVWCVAIGNKSRKGSPVEWTIYYNLRAPVSFMSHLYVTVLFLTINIAFRLDSAHYMSNSPFMYLSGPADRAVRTTCHQPPEQWLRKLAMSACRWAETDTRFGDSSISWWCFLDQVRFSSATF